MNSYPLKFDPILKEKIWGGNKLNKVLNKQTTSDKVGESWEISGVEGSESIVNNGIFKGLTITELLTQFGPTIVGKKNYEQFGNQFPLLIKFLDANANLSVQVHPDDEMAKAEHDSFGKTEMWYIMDHDEDAEIILGLNENQKPEDIYHKVSKNNVYEVFNSEKVSIGDAFFIPAGKVHAIGAGVLAAEIQQTSDITYRVFDWDRVDNSGNSRTLHIDQSIRATKEITDNSKQDIRTNDSGLSTIVECDFFTTNIFDVRNNLERTYDSLDSFVILMCVDGQAAITVNDVTEKICKGETILIPANTSNVTFSGTEAKFLEVFTN